MKLHLPFKLRAAVLALLLLVPCGTYAYGAEEVESTSQTSDETYTNETWEGYIYSDSKTLESYEKVSFQWPTEFEPDYSEPLASAVIDLDDGEQEVFIRDSGTVAVSVGEPRGDVSYALISNNGGKIGFSGNECVSLLAEAPQSPPASVNGYVDNSQGGTLSFENNGQVAFSYDGGDSASPAHMRLVCNDEESNLEFKGNGAVSFAKCDLEWSEGTIYNGNNAKLSFDGNQSVSFCDAYIQQGQGGAIYNEAILSFVGNTKILFDCNEIGPISPSSIGGAIYNSFLNGESKVDFVANGDVTFVENSATSGGAIYNGDNFSFVGNDSVSFRGNTADGTNAFGGAIYNDFWGKFSFRDNKAVTLDGNTASNGGAIYNNGTLTLSGNGNVSFQNNSVENQGGAVCNNVTLTLSGNGDVSFQNNSAKDLGGAIYNSGTLTLSGNGDVSFQNNSAENQGGAIYNAWDVIAIVGNGDVLFRGNVNLASKELNGVYSNYSVTLSATSGKSITFYDNLRSWQLELNKAYQDANGKTSAATGSIIFSGATTSEDLAAAFKRYNLGDAPTDEQILNSRTSELGNATLYGGSLIVRDKAIVKANDLQVADGANATIRLDNGTMGITNSFTLGSGNSLELTNGSTLEAWWLTVNNATVAMDLSGASIQVGNALSITGNSILELTAAGDLVAGADYQLIKDANNDGIVPPAITREGDFILAGLSGKLSWNERNNLMFTYIAATDLSNQTANTTSADQYGEGSLTLDNTQMDLGGQAVQNNLVVEGDSSVSGGEAYDGVIEVNSGSMLAVEDATTARALILNSGTVSGEGIRTEHAILKAGIMDASLTSATAKVEKTTDGTVHLTQENAMAETTVCAGTLVLDADGATGGDSSTVKVCGSQTVLVNNGTAVVSDVAVESGATVQGTGSFKSLSLTASTLKVGDTQELNTLSAMAVFALTPAEEAKFAGRIGTTTVETFALDGSVLAMDITRLSDGSAYNDVLGITGTLTATNVSTLSLTLLDSTNWAAGDSLTFNLFEASDSILAQLGANLTVTLANVQEGLFTIDASKLAVDGSVTLTAANGYNATTGSALIPEPATGALSVLALAALALRRRRQAA